MLSECLAVVLLSSASFWLSLTGNFVFDDTEAIVNNRDLRSDSPISDIFVHDFWGSPITANSSHKSFRPLTTISFKLDGFLSGGLRPFVFHVTNLFLHSSVSLLVYLLALKTVKLCTNDNNFKSTKRTIASKKANTISFTTAIIFAVHPVHTENVAGIVGRADILCAFFVYVSLLLFAKTNHTVNNSSFPVAALCGTVLLIQLAVLSKEIGITAFGLCFAIDAIALTRLDYYINKKEKRVGNIWPFVWRQSFLAIFCCIIMAWRWWIMGGKAPIFQKVDNPASFMDSAIERAVNYNYIYSLNFWILVHPKWLCFDWSMGCVPLIEAISDTRILAIVIFWLAAILLFKVIFSNPSKGDNRLAAMAVSCLVIPFLPVTNLFVTVGFVIAERILYIPSFGYCLLLAIGMWKLSNISPTYNSVVKLSKAILVLVFLSRCIQRTKDWRTEHSLFVSGAEICPLNAKVHYNIAKVAADSGDTNLAESKYRLALRLHPSYDQAMNNLANLLREVGQFEEAKTLLQKAVIIRSDFAAAWMNLGIVEVNLGNFKDAELSYMTAISYRKKYPDCLYNLGNLYLELERYEDAYEAWMNATRLKPTHSLSWNNLIIMLDSTGNLEKAKMIGYNALRHLPKDPSIFFNLGNVLGKMEKFEEAEKCFLAAVEINSSNSNYFANLGVLYHRWKKYSLAEKNYKQALQLNPSHKSTQENLKMLKRQILKNV